MLPEHAIAATSKADFGPPGCGATGDSPLHATSNAQRVVPAHSEARSENGRHSIGFCNGMRWICASADGMTEHAVAANRRRAAHASRRSCGLDNAG